MRWGDVHSIAAALDEVYPTMDIMRLNFVDLKKMVMELEGFEGDVQHCNERILERIQELWIEERA